MRRVGVKRSIQERSDGSPVAIPSPKRLKVLHSRARVTSSPPLYRRFMAGCSRLWRGVRNFFAPQGREGGSPEAVAMQPAAPYMGDENVHPDTSLSMVPGALVKTTPTNHVITTSNEAPPPSDGLQELFPSDRQYTSPLPPITPSHHHTSQTREKHVTIPTSSGYKHRPGILQELQRSNERQLYSQLLPAGVSPSHPHHPHTTSTHLFTHSQRPVAHQPSPDHTSWRTSKPHTNSYTPHTTLSTKLPVVVNHRSSPTSLTKATRSMTDSKTSPRYFSQYSSTPAFTSSGGRHPTSLWRPSSVEDISPLREPSIRGDIQDSTDDVRITQSVCSREVQTISAPLPYNNRTVDAQKSRNWIDQFQKDHAHSKAEIIMKEKMIRESLLRERLQRERMEDERVARLREQLSCVGLDIGGEGAGLEEEELCLHLTPDQQDKVAMATRGGNGCECLSERFNISITRNDITTLTHLNWLNDEIMNFYFHLIVERGKSGCGRCKVHAMTSFFYPKLSQVGYSGVRRWTKKVDIFSQDLVLIPIHLGMHWALAVMDMRRSQLVYYDSLHGNNVSCLQRLKAYLVSEASDKKGQLLDPSSWDSFSATDIPMQMNGSDCGVFTCMYARHLANDAPFSFSQSDMPGIREAMISEILEQKLF